MAETQCTLRIDRTGDKYQLENIGRAYAVKFPFGRLWFPITFTTITETDKFIDIDCPLWFAKKNHLDDYIVAEY